MWDVGGPVDTATKRLLSDILVLNRHPSDGEFGEIEQKLCFSVARASGS